MTRRTLCQTLAFLAPPPQPKRILGRWGAWAGGEREYSGTFTAVETAEPDVSEGTWTLFDINGYTILSGTWSARKLSGRWSGGWRAETKLGAIYSGTWDTITKLAPSDKFLDMLLAALDDDVTGTWKTSIGHSGTWAIRIDSVR